ncbi:DUF488 domain-containing protein [Tetragenococcus halophilus]|uniref:DUF488 domain-containing protein n=2 Tax=Tetragenococcus halophilus TaxID=51669 RepID=A0A2H6CQF9_TETHA|nr:DUF488 family protein [Tetragenococcus halophilus]AOF48721.1 uroporphyrin-III C-methyltransferase [Tetragenococcus halophilus]MCO8286225.1 DUF488 family protein [Tetragenococcus halophilus]MCO8293066.1 DUF488 family protein [Tetragenococcus halophilus]QGP75413.1 DUF488 family protein [Tetragenococcus halophilus]GBD67230.1 putative uncharacterized protein [Tetragenococcus halophilus subsp. halophilus]
MGNLQIKRAYEDIEPSDGKRILVDRMWPRGIKKEKLALALWEKGIAPTNDLRKEFGHDPEKFPWFEKEYKKELDNNDKTQEFVEQIADWLQEDNVTLIYGAKDKKYNQAVVLKDYLQEKVAS